MKQINIMELWSIIDNWHSNNSTVNVKITTKNDAILEGVATTGKLIPEYIKYARPTHLYINKEQEILLSNIKMIEFDGCCYLIDE